MDLFDYAQALFNEQGDLWVPGLGYFSKKRNNSYYDDEAQMIYPPRYAGSFEEHLDNTDASFIAYFSKSKNLSQGSSKYFVDKFVENIKEQLQHGEVTFGALGTLFLAADGKIGFKGSELSPANDGALYGLAPVALTKLAPYISTDEDAETNVTTSTSPLASDQLPENDSADVPAETAENTDEETGDTLPGDEAIATDLATPTPRRAYDPNNFYTDDRVLVLKGRPQEAERSNRYQFWMLAALIGIVVLAGIYFVTQNMLAPTNEDGSKGDVSNQILSHTVRSDTVANTAQARADSDLAHAMASPSALPSTVDTSGVESALGSSPNTPRNQTSSEKTSDIPQGSWLLSGGQNNNYDAAQRLVDRYHKMGYSDARMIDSVRKKDYFVYRVIFGFYNTASQAREARSILLEEKKLKPQSITVQKYK